MDETTTLSETDTETTVVDIRTTRLDQFETGEAVRIHYKTADDEPHKCLTGRVATHYTERKAMLETDDGRRLVVDLADVTEDNIRDFETGEWVGRGMFAETAYHPEQDGEALREELLGDDDQDDEGDDAVVEVADAVQEGDEILVEYELVQGDRDGDAHSHTGTVTNVSKAGSLVQYRTEGQKGTNTVSLRSGAVHVQNTVRDIHVGRDAEVTVLEEADE